MSSVGLLRRPSYNLYVRKRKRFLMTVARRTTYLVHSGNSSHVNDSKTSSGGCGSLNGTVLLGTEVSTTGPPREEATHRLEDGETEDGSEKLRTESETRLQTEVQVGGLDDGSEKTSDDYGSDGELPQL